MEAEERKEEKRKGGGERRRGGKKEGGVSHCQRLLEASTLIDTLCSGTCSIASALRSLCRFCQPGAPWSAQT